MNQHQRPTDYEKEVTDLDMSIIILMNGKKINEHGLEKYIESRTVYVRKRPPGSFLYLGAIDEEGINVLNAFYKHLQDQKLVRARNDLKAHIGKLHVNVKDFMMLELR